MPFRDLNCHWSCCSWLLSPLNEKDPIPNIRCTGNCNGCPCGKWNK